MSADAALVAVETRRAASPTCPTAWATAATVFGSSVQADPASRAHATAWRPCSRIKDSASRSRSSKERHRLPFDPFANARAEIAWRDDVDMAIEKSLELRLEPREVDEREAGIGSGFDENVEVRRRTE